MNNITRLLGLLSMASACGLGGGAAHASGVDGGPFLKVCEAALRKHAPETQQKEAFQSGYCIGVLDASAGALLAEAAEARRTDNGLCPKEDSGDPLLLVKIVVKYLKENPQTHSLPAEVPIRAALRKAFPCP
ncbi:Rap1a/Tai family immunity protein [Variovorax sp. PAMC26660]|uniref:Rap1a/Tai family immunity protein n=1 Tax=Variovorax sp. PAMC26660 TaxID=2762322 RepID=UPI00164ED6A5|nr:Rap1a/Tai family immunity protein [Variovorax sp. PAMC26660]QNK66862.1 hypothetical protein H7F35_27385 [Variovorax sp. PAMC26660]